MPHESRHSLHKGGWLRRSRVNGMSAPAKKLGAKGGIGKKGPVGKKAPAGGKKGKGAAAQGARPASSH